MSPHILHPLNMRSRSVRLRALAAVLPLLAAVAACQDEPPTLTGDEFFPGGGRPVTLEVILPASEFLQTRAVYTGYTNQNSAGFLVLANRFSDTLNANGLLRFESFPTEVSYTQDGASRLEDYAARNADLIVEFDTSASARPGAVTLQLYELAQAFDPGSATWELAVDTTGQRTPWTQAGGTRGPLVAQATLPATGADSVVFALDSALVNRLRAKTSPGLLLTIAQTETRLQVAAIRMVARVRPIAPVRDTTLTLTVPSGPQTFVFTPNPPQPAGTFQVGGLFSARTLFDLDLEREVPGCPTGETCAPVALGDVELNRVSLLLRPLPTPAGYDLLERLPLTLRTVAEPELGFRAPLGPNILDPVDDAQVVVQNRTDTVVEVPITFYARQVARGDTTLPTTLALLAESATGGVVTFGLGVYEPTPRLRIVYTLPVRPRLP